MSGVRWDLLANAPNPGEAFTQAFEKGTKAREERELREAIGALQGGDRAALRRIYELSPQMGAAMEDQLHQRDERQRAGDLRGAQSEILMQALRGGNAPQASGMPSNALASPTQNALQLPMPEDGQQGYTPRQINGGDPLAPLPAQPQGGYYDGGSQSTPGPTSMGTASAATAGPVHLQNAPDPSRAARERAIRADPGAYLTFEGNRLDLTEKKLKTWKSLNDGAMQILGGVHDQASWNRARFYASKLYREHGENIADLGLPDQYSPELIEELRLRGANAAQQMAAVARENRLDWDIEDDRLDNERADENLESLRTYRHGSLRDRQTRTGKMGQGRGGARPGSRPDNPKTEAALYTDIMRRWTAGEEPNAREQEFVRSYNAQRNAKIKGKPRAARGGGGASRDGAIIVNPQTGARMRLQGGKWVPIK